MNVLHVVQPDIIERVFEELTLHLQDLVTIALLDVLSHFQALPIHEHLHGMRSALVDQIPVCDFLIDGVVDLSARVILESLRRIEVDPHELAELPSFRRLNHSLEDLNMFQIVGVELEIELALRVLHSTDAGRKFTAIHDQDLLLLRVAHQFVPIDWQVLAQPVEAFYELCILLFSQFCVGSRFDRSLLHEPPVTGDIV